MWYTIDERDECIALDGIPRPSGGAPFPLVIADDTQLLVAYFVDDPWPPNPEQETIAILRFLEPSAHAFGLPDHNDQDRHPLYDRLFETSGYAEVKNSSWIRTLEMQYNYELDNKKHFVFLFKDSTLECVAKGFEVTTHRGTLKSVLPQLAAMLLNEN